MSAPKADRRVLHVLPHPRGGGERYVDLLARMDGYRGEKIFLAPSSAPTPRALARAVRAQIAASRYDLLHVHGEVAGALVLPMLALRPSVITLHGINVVRRAHKWRHSIAVANLRALTRAASITICVGDAELAEVRTLVGQQRRLALVRNGLDPLPATDADTRMAVRTELDIPPDVIVGVYLGELEAHKAPMDVARAAINSTADGPGVILVFAGDGTHRAELEALAAGTHVLRVLGYRADALKLLAAADFFVLPSLREGLSFALLEAMWLGLPVVVSDAPGNIDAIGDAGIIVARGHVAGYLAAFRQLREDEGTRRRLGNRARRRAQERFEVSAMVRGTKCVYDAVLVTRE